MNFSRRGLFGLLGATALARVVPKGVLPPSLPADLAAWEPGAWNAPTFSVIGALPAGMALNAVTGEILGVPEKTGEHHCAINGPSGLYKLVVGRVGG